MANERITKEFKIEASPEVMERIERFLALLHWNSNFGHGGMFAMPLYGDGNDKVTVFPKPGYRPEVDLLANVSGDVEIAVDGGYTAKQFRDPASYWKVVSVAGLFKDGDLVQTRPNALREDE